MVDVILGTQWGDEGKGKLVDNLSSKYDIVARYQGGANAGHTVKVGDNKYILHLIPSGILHPRVTCVIGNGTVVDPITLKSEIEELESRGVAVGKRLKISSAAHVIMPYHRVIDILKESSSGAGKRVKIGTTGRGIGPAYADKYSRTGLRIGDLTDRKVLRDKIRRNLAEKVPYIRHVLGASPLQVRNVLASLGLENFYSDKTLFDEKKLVRFFLALGNYMEGYVENTQLFLNHAIKNGKKILAEGAQGTMLDIDHGTYPFVTSSNPTAGGVCVGLGIPPSSVKKVIGVMKAYTTRVGSGPFPTELKDRTGRHLQEKGHEFGATTGRPRRCGWLDAVLVKKAVAISGITEIAMTKLDVLDELAEIKVAVAYRGERPVYRKFPGWQQDTSSASSFDELPLKARRYIRAVEKLVGTRISIVSVGPGRRQTIRVPRG
ncbi:adenylosuccinate synthase [Candidatus Woesearchaeota archaeon]|nr:MAG: adenylosuccinate synthase [Candidatus Woesearchaeota archaeon]